MKVVLTLIGIALMAAFNSASAQQASDDTGASLAWTSNDPIVQKSIALLNEGKFNEAQTLLASDDGHADTQVAQARLEMQDLIVRLRHEYSLDENGLLAKLRESIPDVTPADLRKWRDAGQAQYRVIDGKVMYFRGEPSNIFRFCDEAKQRAKRDGTKKDREPDADAKWHLVDHLKEILKQAGQSESPFVNPVKHRIEYTLTIPANTQGVNKGSLLRVWLPFPQEYRQQRDVKMLSMSPRKYITLPSITRY